MNQDKKVSEKDLHLLKNIVGILQEFNVTYWLDQGSLLGIVRDGEFLPWDHDIDLGVWASNIENHIPEIVKKLRLLGARVDAHPHKISVSQGKYRASGLPICMRLYSIEAGHASALFTILPYHSRSRWIYKIVRHPLGFFKFCGHLFIYLGSMSYPRHPLLYRIGVKIYEAGSKLQESFRFKRITFRSPERHFRALVEQTIYEDIQVFIPEHAESYLAFKYGDDWRTPKKKWTYWEDDGALVKSVRT